MMFHIIDILSFNWFKMTIFTYNWHTSLFLLCPPSYVGTGDPYFLVISHIFFLYCHVFRGGVTYRWGMDWILDLLITYVHCSELHFTDH
jgi:hypothetical protein